MVQVAGNGKHNSDQFDLKAGLYIVKVSHTGKRYCGIWLLAADGDAKELITNGTGYIIESKAVKLEHSGNYLFNVEADGAWTIHMEYQAPKIVEQPQPIEHQAPTAASSKPVTIKLKSGRIIKADTYWEEGSKLKVSIYGGIMSIDRNDVVEVSDAVK